MDEKKTWYKQSVKQIIFGINQISVYFLDIPKSYLSKSKVFSKQKDNWATHWASRLRVSE